MLSKESPGRMSDRVPLAPFREAFERSGLTANELAFRMGYMRANSTEPKHADSSRIQRLLNLRPGTASTKNGKYYPAHFKYNDTLPYELAVRLAEALGVDPWEVGV